MIVLQSRTIPVGSDGHPEHALVRLFIHHRSAHLVQDLDLPLLRGRGLCCGQAESSSAFGTKELLIALVTGQSWLSRALLSLPFRTI